MLTSKDYSKASASIIILLFVAGLLVGGLLIFFISYQRVSNLNGQISSLRSQVSDLRGFQNATTQNITIFQNGTSLEEIYSNVRSSVVLVQGDTSSGGVQGSGFVYNFAGQMVVLTNFHVVEGSSRVQGGVAHHLPSVGIGTRTQHHLHQVGPSRGCRAIDDGYFHRIGRDGLGISARLQQHFR